MQEDLTPETAEKILNAFKKGEKPHPGPQSGRKSCENSAGLTALTEAPPGPGFKVRADL
jgi:NADH dehydrogenase (ubiquinone) flavoprotein 2